MEENKQNPLVQEEKDESETLENTENGLAFKTVSKDDDAKSVEERLKEMEAFLESINEKLSDSEDIKAFYDDMVNFYAVFENKAKEISQKLDNDFEYKNFLESEIKRRQENLEKLGFMKSLKEDRVLMASKIDEMTRILDDRLLEIDARQHEEMGKIEAKIFQFAGILEKFVVMDDKIQEELDNFRKEMSKSSNTEFNLLEAKSRESIARCTEKVEAIKKDVLTFLKACEKQNGILINKIPIQKRSFGLKDVIIYVLSGLSALGLIIQVAMMIFKG